MSIMQIILNGEPYSLTQNTSLQALLDRLELESEKVAIEQNREIIPHSQFGATQIMDGDQIEIVHFIGGG